MTNFEEALWLALERVRKEPTYANDVNEYDFLYLKDELLTYAKEETLKDATCKEN